MSIKDLHVSELALFIYKTEEMLGDIKKELLQQLEEREYDFRWHPHKYPKGIGYSYIRKRGNHFYEVEDVFTTFDSFEEAEKYVIRQEWVDVAREIQDEG